jgi:hypothetical protein
LKKGIHTFFTVDHGHLLLIMCFLFLPLLQYRTGVLAPREKLKGSFEKAPVTHFGIEKWFAGKYQDEKGAYWQSEFNERTIFSRLKFQLDFSLFHKAHARYVVVGKNNYLYEQAYIDAYYGRDFIGAEKITGIIRRLKQAQDSMEKKGKLLLVVLAPGKASFYPEFIPDRLRSKPGMSNYACFSALADSLKLNTVDFN